jgi:hypothetical protein
LWWYSGREAMQASGALRRLVRVQADERLSLGPVLRPVRVVFSTQGRAVCTLCAASGMCRLCVVGCPLCRRVPYVVG